MAVSETIRWRPRLPLAGAYHCMSLSSQIVNDPRVLSAALYAAQLVVLQRVLAPLGAAMPRSYQPGEPALCNKANSILNGIEPKKLEANVEEILDKFRTTYKFDFIVVDFRLFA